jgi:adenosylcobyric acid synthase
MTMGETPHKTRARSVAVLDTGSDVGKSLVVAGVCRLLCRAGANVAPFKAQNMSLNSFVTTKGGEMGRAQVLQAQACGIAPNVLMNPLLLTPEADCRSQVIAQGKVWERQEALEYFNKKAVLWDLVKSSYEEFAKTLM